MEQHDSTNLEQRAANIHERALLMARAEGQALCDRAELGQDIYTLWVEGMDASEPHQYCLADWYDDLATLHDTSIPLVQTLFESVRLIIVRYDELIAQAS